MYFLKNRVFTYFIITLSILAGIFMMSSTPKELYPEIKIPVVVVSTVYPGASAEDIEDSVTNKLEDVLVGGIENVNEISSQSKEGVSIITVEFKESVDIQDALLDVQDKVNAKKGELPDGAEEPVVSRVNFTDQPIFTFALSSTEAYNQLRIKAEDIESNILKIAGVSDVTISGIPEREITILLSPEKLSQFNISAYQVVSAIQSTKQTFPAGSILFDDREYRISYDSGIDTVEDLYSIIVDTQQNGSKVYISDVVEYIEDGVSRYDSYARIGSPEKPLAQQAIIFNVKKQEGGNIISLTQEIKEVLEQYKETNYQEEIDFTVIFDAGKEIKTNLNDLVGSGFQTVILILVVMGLMVGFQESIIAAIAVPLSFLLTFIGMNFFGITINFITLFSLILVIGILIDSAIVIVEGIHDSYQEDKSLFEASAYTLKEYSKPVVAGVLTTISIFIPLMMLSGILGQFIGGIPRVIIIVLVMSLIVALVFIPATAAIIYKFKIKDSEKISRKRNEIFSKITKWYHNFLSQLINNSKKKRRIIWILTGLILSTFVLVGSGLVKSEFFSPDYTEQGYINIELAEGTPLEITSDALRQVEEVVLTQERIIDFTSIIGSESSFVGQGRSGSNFANIIVNFDDKKYGQEGAEKLRTALSGIHDFHIQVLTPESGPPVGAPFQVKIEGETWQDINLAAEEVARLLESFSSTRDVDSGVDVGSTEIQLEIIHDRLAEYGLRALDISSILRTSLYGTTATSLNIGNEGDIDVVVKLGLNPEGVSHRDSNHINYDQIKNLRIPTNQGEVLLGYFVQERVVQSTSVASHVDGNKNKTVTSYVQDGFLPVDIVQEFNERQSELVLPESVSFELAGSDSESDEASTELLVSLVFGLLLIFGVLIWQFGSLRSVFFIISVIPLGLIGVVYGLFFTGLSLSFTAMLGFIALVGVIVNNSIILIDVMNKIQEREPDLSKKEIVLKGAITRLRPILLTTLTTVLGMVPLLYVSPMWTPFALAMITGLSFSTILTLVVIPIFYHKWG